MGLLVLEDRVCFDFNMDVMVGFSVQVSNSKIYMSCCLSVVFFYCRDLKIILET